MGCKQSRQVKVQPAGNTELRRDLAEKKLRKTDSEHDPIDQDIEDQTRRKGKRNKSSKSNRTLGSCGSLVDDDQSQESDRGGSAGSKTSKHSNDSGLGDDYNHVITEYSDVDKVKQVEEGFEEREIDAPHPGAGPGPREAGLGGSIALCIYRYLSLVWVNLTKNYIFMTPDMTANRRYRPRRGA